MNKKIIILGGGTNTYISEHLALSAPAYGTTARILANRFKEHPENKMDGELILTKGTQINSFTTPNHRHLVSKRTSKGWQPLEVKTSGELFNSSCKYITAGNLASKYSVEYPIPLDLLGFYIGDGSEDFHRLNFHLKVPRKIAYLKSIDSGVIANKSDNYQSSNRCGKWLTEHCRTETQEKKLPDDYLKMSAQQWHNLKQGLRNSDGSLKRNTWVYDTTSFVLAEQIQALAHLHNESCSISKRELLSDKHKPVYRLNFSKRVTPEHSVMQSGRNSKSTNTRAMYSGFVYCPTVSTGFLLVRREGKIMISGNSPFVHIAVLDYKPKGSYKSWSTYRHILDNQ